MHQAAILSWVSYPDVHREDIFKDPCWGGLGPIYNTCCMLM